MHSTVSAVCGLAISHGIEEKEESDWAGSMVARDPDGYAHDSLASRRWLGALSAEEEKSAGLS